MDSRPPQQRTPAEASRDAGLRRVSTLTKWVAVGAVASVGALAGFVAQAKPGHSTTPSQSPGGGASSAPSPSTSGAAAANGGANGSSGQPAPTLSPPVTAPAPTPSPPAVVSGGS